MRAHGASNHRKQKSLPGRSVYKLLLHPLMVMIIILYNEDEEEIMNYIYFYNQSGYF